MTGRLFDTHRLSTHDGPGFRTALFLKGCPLRCRWCHNPEGLEERLQFVIQPRRCINCGVCQSVCPTGAVRQTATGKRIDQQACNACGICAVGCPSRAVRRFGTEASVPELMKIIRADRMFYETSGGGLTLSGGEPALQGAFVRDLFAACRKESISTALDTSGCVPWDALEKLLPDADIVLYDLKMTEESVTPGMPDQDLIVRNARLIFDNFRMLIAFKKTCRPDLRIWVRTPLVPEATATRENIRQLSMFLRPFLGGAVERWELCAFHTLCRDKYEMLGIDWLYRNATPLSRSEAETFGTIAREGQSHPECVRVTGFFMENDS